MSGDSDHRARQWRQGLDQLSIDRPLHGFVGDRWKLLIDDGYRFLDRWAGTARRHGWTSEDLFGVHPIAPSARYDCMGLVPLISGGEVIDMSPDRTTIRMPSGNCLVFYLRRPNTDAVVLWKVAEMSVTQTA